ncbi:MAG: hypothetical protein IKY52_02565 [Clostridia bacterium]|nr:hypothetical protein [Clostridia bacterium]
MRKTYKRVLAMLLAAMMTAGTFMVPSASAQDSDESSYASEAMATLANTTSSPANAFTGKPFTGTADLIQDSIKYVLENGVAPSGGQEDWLAADVEAQSGMSLDAVMSGIFRGISDKENNGYMNTAIYHLDEVTMEAVMERVLSRYSLVDAVTYSLDTVDGEVIGISYELKEALSVALDEIEVNAATGNDESAIADAVERAEANAAEKFGGEANFEDGDGEQTEETPDEEIPEEEAHEHLYANPVSVQWADGYTTCTAVFTCTECTDDVEGHILTETTNNISYAEGTDTTIVAYFECNGFTAETTLEEHIHIYNPNDTETFTFSWYDYRTVNDDADGDGQPDMSMVYDPTYDPAGDPSYDPATGMGKYVMYDSSTGIGVSMVNKIVVDCGGLTIKCTGCDNTIEVAADNEGLIVDTMYLDATGQPTYDPNAIIMEMMTAAYALTPDTIFSTTLDSAEYRLKIHWSEMTHFFREHPEYYGTSAPFWTSKNTNETPLQAIKVLCNMGDLVFVPNPNMDYMVEMLTQAFIAYVMQYGYMLQYTVYDAMACLDDSMTDIQKMLVMHDWLAKNATFDMQSLIDSKSGESEGADPISFTPFGTLLANQIGTDGAICLGYAAAYNFLLQYAFPEHYMNADGEWLSPEEADHITDFVQIKFHADVAESSVAGGDSGFGEGIFNEPHYFNAVRLPDEETGIGSDYWYYVDACYDDVSVEVISQYRVETDGNISHMYFLNSPQSFIDQFEGNFDYFDSAYDGYVWQPNYVLDENGQPFMGEDGKLVTEKDEDGYTIYTQYTAEDEFMYDDDQFEQTWFSNIVSEILYDADYWYYVEGSGGSYASMKDLFGDNGFGNSNGSGNSSFGDMMDSDTMAQFTDDPANGDKLKRRGREFGDRPEEEGNTSNSFGSTSYEDPHAEVLFHYGYGSVGAPETDEEGNALNGAFYDLVVIDKAFNDKYPDLVHSVALYEKNKQLYFNLGDTILVYSLKNSRVKQLKEYNTVHAVTNGKRFTGMSFYTTNNVEDEAYTFTVKDHPIAALTINQVITWERDEQGNPLMDESGQPSDILHLLCM